MDLITAERFSRMSQSLHELLLEAAGRYSMNTAAVLDSGVSVKTCLTYTQLTTLAQDLSRNLRLTAGNCEHVIGVFCEVNIFLPVYITGILLLPAAYVPLDPVSPPVHTLRIVDKCSMRFCLVQISLLQKFQSAFSSLVSIEVCETWSTFNITLVKMHINSVTSSQAVNGTWTVDDQILQREQAASQRPSDASTVNVHQGEQLAYVLHTSGTTGLPKIVKVPHKCILPNIIHLRSLFQMTPEDVVFLASPLTFDPSVVEMFLALTSGACLLMVPSAVKKMPGMLAHVLFKRNTTTILQATPTLMRRFGGRVLKEEVLSAGSSLRVLALGGEQCPSVDLLKSWRQEGNKTRIYNLYGTTEVSCWACCYELPTDTTMSAGSVPLGKPLMDTAVEVRDESGRVVTEGEGQVFIGGHERVCLLDDEMTPAKGTMRATGDWVMVKDSQLFYLGRKDRLVKRHGQRIHLDALQQAAESLPQVDSCVMGLHEGSRLVAFIVPKNNKNTLSMSERGLDQDHLSSSSAVRSDVFKEIAENSSYSSKSLEKFVLQEISQLFPSHCIPDAVVLVPALPLTNHGKVAMKKLMKMFERQREVSCSAWGDMETAKEKLQMLWKECLGLDDDAEIMEDARFMLSGGDSLQALRLYDYITNTLGATSPGLLEVLLDGSFSDVLKHIIRTSPTYTHTSSKRQHEDSTSLVPSKRHHIDVTSNISSEMVMAPKVSSEKGLMGFVVVRRAGEVLKWDYSENREQRLLEESIDNTKQIQTLTKQSSLTVVGKMDEKNSFQRESVASQHVDINHSKIETLSGELESQYTNKESGNPSQSAVNTQPLKLQVSWSSDTGRCVDASPVLLVSPEKSTVFIGSHSHRLQALDLTSGEVVWERVLGDRLESSAAVSKCGTLVAVGSYDGQVYFLHVDSGETWWMFETKDAVKSSPTIDTQTDLVIIGSHDGHVYALEPLAKRCVWKHHCGGGAVFSSPCVHSCPRRLYAATLGGQLHCLSPDNGEILWKYSSDVPFFSSPTCSDSCVCIGLVNNNIRALSHDGKVLWNFCTDGPVFSSPCLSPGPSPAHQRTTSTAQVSGVSIFQAVVCGSHDCSVYCLNTADGSLLWQFRTTGKVYSSPFVFDGTLWGMRTLVAVASTDGTVWVLDGEQGTLNASFSLPGELFSSPIVWNRTLVVGCRNDYVYCLELTGSK